MQTDAFDYDLPPDAIAQVPAEPRPSARLLVDRGPTEPPVHRTVADLADLLGPGDVLVLNETRVIPARLRLRKPTGAQVEVLLTERCADGRWEALVRPSRRVPPGTVLEGLGPGRVVVGADLGEGRRLVVLDHDRASDAEALAEEGEIPLPPYIHAPLRDPARYQTVYATRPGSVAAPTAGLHLTEEVLDRGRDRGVTVVRLDLSIGLGTFRPITTEQVEDHPMHGERYAVPALTRSAVRAARAEGGRVVAVGTTVARALEAEAATGRAQGRTDLFIHGDYEWQAVDLLLTNFHVPRSSLLVLVDAFVGPRWRRLYEAALAERYRFLSFGDCMLLDRRWGRRP